MTLTATQLDTFLASRHPSPAELATLLCLFGDWFSLLRADFVY